LPGTYLILAIFSGGITSLLVVAPLVLAYPPVSERNVLLGIAIAIAIPAIICYWLSCFKLTITQDTVTYTSLLGGEKVMRVVEITDTGFIDFRRSALQVKTASMRIVINYRVFSGKARYDLFEAVKFSEFNPNEA
jgi:hypothetical protein